ncbi:MAG: hypothetical protein ACI4TP_03310 [Anaerotignum sp.]
MKDKSDIMIKIYTIDSCFYALDRIIDEVSRGDASTEHIENLFFLIWDQVKSVKEDCEKVLFRNNASTASIIKQLQDENESLKSEIAALKSK